MSKTADGQNVANAELEEGGALLSVRSLSVRFGHTIQAAQTVNLDIHRSESVALVGESGSGKTTVLRAIAGLLGGAQVSGKVAYRGEDILGRPEAQLRPLRGREIALLFQDPVNSFNPSLTIGAQLRRVLSLHRPDLSRTRYDSEIVAMLHRVGIDGRNRLKNYPFEFSQGQLQRIMIAAVCLGARPSLLLADEPTTSLDVTTEAQVLELLRELRSETGMALLLVTHNLAVAAQLCDRVIVMYAGRVMEEAPISQLFDSPTHPYTRQLLRSLPRFPHEGGRLPTIPGEAKPGMVHSQGCAFWDRCSEFLGDVCRLRVPDLVPSDPSGGLEQRAACHRYSTVPDGAASADEAEPAR
jgi:oligopeptide/dipeptide ABC transporter ATP-binding protein